MQMAEKWKGSCCSLPMDQPCALHGNIKKVGYVKRPIPLPWPDWKVICANVLIHSVNSSHVPIVQVNHDRVMSMDFLSARDHIFAIPNGSMPWWFNAIVTTLLSFHRVIMISVLKSCLFSYAPHLNLRLFHRRHWTFCWLAPFQSTEGSFRPIYEADSCPKEFICSDMKRVSSCQV